MGVVRDHLETMEESQLEGEASTIEDKEKKQDLIVGLPTMLLSQGILDT